MMIRLKIDVTKIDKSALFTGKNGAKYLDLTLLENRNGPDKYGNDFMCVQDIGKERRLAGEKGPILGNGKKLDGQTTSQPKPETTTRTFMKPPAPTADQAADQLADDSIPF